jgi:hypothetical protein
MSGVIQIAPDWRVNHDRLQWILEHQRGNRWRAVAFVEGNKSVLVRVLREKGAVYDTAVLDVLPETFKEDRASGFNRGRAADGRDGCQDTPDNAVARTVPR